MDQKHRDQGREGMTGKKTRAMKTGLFSIEMFSSLDSSNSFVHDENHMGFGPREIKWATMGWFAARRAEEFSRNGTVLKHSGFVMEVWCRGSERWRVRPSGERHCVNLPDGL